MRTPRKHSTQWYLCIAAALLVAAGGAGALVTGIGGCSFFGDNTLHVVSDNPQIQLYVDYYNLTVPNAHAILIYQENVSVEQISASQLADYGLHTAPDVIIGSHVTHNASLRELRRVHVGDADIGAQASGGGETESAVQSIITTLSNDTNGRNRKLLPLGYNLPLLVFSRESGFVFEDPVTTTLEEIRELAGSFTVYEDGEYQRIGYSPLWNGTLLYLGTIIYGSTYTQGRNDLLVWEEEAIFNALDYFQAWIADDPDPRRRDIYSEKYYREPVHRAVLNGEIAFAYMSVTEFAALEFGQQQRLDFRILASPAGITPLDDTVYGALPRGSRNPAEGRRFLRWLLDSEVQEHLIRESINQRVGLFGFAGGLSSNHDVTTFVIPRYYEWLWGHVPGMQRILSSPAKPSNWPQLRDEVIIPWLENYLHGEAQRSLAVEVNSWYQRKTFR